jgi:hypothetical protein
MDEFAVLSRSEQRHISLVREEKVCCSIVVDSDVSWVQSATMSRPMSSDADKTSWVKGFLRWLVHWRKGKNKGPTAPIQNDPASSNHQKIGQSGGSPLMRIASNSCAVEQRCQQHAAAGPTVLMWMS